MGPRGVTGSGPGVIPISVELAVGTLSETLTVTGESPLVDTQTTRRETVISAETIATLPMTRNYGGVLYATPGLNVQPGVNANDLMPRHGDLLCPRRPEHRGARHG